MALAIATNTGPAAWRGEDDETIATALAILTEQNERATRGHRR